MFTIISQLPEFALLCTHGISSCFGASKIACPAAYAVADFSFLCQVPAVDAQSCAAELHHALAKNDYQQASSLIRLAPHPGVFEMVNKQQQNALHLAGGQHQHRQLPFKSYVTLPGASCPAYVHHMLACLVVVAAGVFECIAVHPPIFDTCLDAACCSCCSCLWSLYTQAEMYSNYLVLMFM